MIALICTKQLILNEIKNELFLVWWFSGGGWSLATEPKSVKLSPSPLPSDCKSGHLFPQITDSGGELQSRVDSDAVRLSLLTVT